MSGGADSVALLLGLQRLASELHIELAAAHLHHGLRGLDADADEAFVRALCVRLGVPLESARWNTRERMRRLGWSGQDGLRRLRRRFLLQAARRAGADLIATGHTADDQMETLLMRLMRGTGLSGLGAMSSRRGRWLRPLLEAPRADIEADLRAAGESWREDASNQDPAYERNRIRYRVVPAWIRQRAQRGPSARRIATTLREVRAVTRWLEGHAKRALEDSAIDSAGPGLVFDRTRLATLPDFLLRLALRRAWGSTRPRQGLTRPLLNECLTLVRSSARGRVDLPGGWSAWGGRERIGILPSTRGIEETAHPIWTPVELRVPGRNRLAGFELHASWVAGHEARRRLAGRSGGEAFAATHIKGTLELRLGRTDEMFIPFGRHRARRLGDFLKHSGIPLPHRGDRMVLADRQGILWVVGLRRSARAPIESSTRKALWVRAKT